jgi:hypothetical protein
MKARSYLLLSSAIAVPTLAIGLAMTPVSAAETQTSNGKAPRAHAARFFKKMHDIGNPGMKHVELTAEQKNILEQAKALHEQGKHEEARTFLKDSGLFKDMKKGVRHRIVRFANHEAIRNAIKNNNFVAFKALIKDAPFADKIDETTFAKMVEAHKLMEAGDAEAAHAILKDLGHGHMLPMGKPGFGQTFEVK